MTLDEVFADHAFVAQLGRRLRSRALRRFPLLRADADDLVNQTLQDLWSYASRTPGRWGDWTRGDKGDYEGSGWDAMARVANTILDRRAADTARDSADRWADETLTGYLDDSRATQAGTPSLPRHLLLQQMLAVCMAELARASAQERDTLLSAVGDNEGPGGAAGDAQRQRLSRLRRRLADAIQRKLGESAKALLAAELRDD